MSIGQKVSVSKHSIARSSGLASGGREVTASRFSMRARTPFMFQVAIFIRQSRRLSTSPTEFPAGSRRKAIHSDSLKRDTLSRRLLG